MRSSSSSSPRTPPHGRTTVEEEASACHLNERRSASFGGRPRPGCALPRRDAACAVLVLLVGACGPQPAAAYLGKAGSLWPKVVVGSWKGCLAQINMSDDRALWHSYDRHVMSLVGTEEARAAAGCVRFCGLHNYFGDRCVTPRSWCVLGLVGEDYSLSLSSPLNQPRLNPPGTALVAGQYVVILGAASAIGTTVPTPYDEMLVADGYHVVNLGRGSAGPMFYMEDWSAIERLVVNAAIVVVNVMSVRASWNDWCGHDCPGTQRMALWRTASEEDKLRMEEQSMNHSMAEHEIMLSAIQNSPHRLGSGPRRVLLWHSRCHFVNGCAEGGFFPQWLTNPERVARLKAVPGWDEIVDASYYGYDPSTIEIMPINKCEYADGDAPHEGKLGGGVGQCAHRDPSITKVCTTEEVRSETKRGDKDGCTHSCAFLQQDYYPIQLGHNMSYQAIKPRIDAALEAWTLKPEFNAVDHSAQ